MTTRAKPLVSSALLSRGFGSRGTDFEIYTAAAVADDTTDLPVVRMVGSSTVKDLHGDIMTLTALQDMANGNPDLTIFLNHEYNVPDDVFGKLHGKPEVRMAGNVADLHLAALADLSRDEPGRYPHSKAYDTYTQIKKGKIRLGSSVGCQVTQYQFLDPDDFFSGILIEHVTWVEHSIVGVPASQRAWVEQAIKGLFERALVQGDADEARQLAPAMKSLWDGPYDTILREVESESLRRDLARTKARGTGPQRILYDFTQSGFVLAGPRNVKKSLTIEDVDGLLNQASVTPAEVAVENVAVENGEEVDATKAASGKTSWPLMSIGTEWTGSKAEKQIFDWARNEQDEIVSSKARQCFLYYNPDESDKQSGYKMPFCYISDGSPKIVPLGVRACAGVLDGSMGGVHASDEDKSGMKAKVKTMYGRINSEFHPDPEWEVPWEKEKDAEPGVQKEIADSSSDAALNRQDVGEVEVGDDGSHEPFTGTHTHPHKAYGAADGGMHSHEHSHDGDAHHGHSHEEMKSADVVKCGCCDDCTGMADCTCCDACTMKKAVDGTEDVHKHAHTEDAHHDHVDVQPDTVKALPQPTPEQTALLSVYNSIGKQLGFPEHSLTTKCDLVENDSDVTVVRTMLASLDDVSDAMIGMAQRNEFYVDSLMRLLGVPDVNDEVDGDEDEGAGMMSMRSQQPTLTKDGGTLSSDHRTHLQMIHDMVCAMHPDACKGMSGDGTSHQDGTTTVAEAQEEARQMGQGDSYSNLSSLMATTVKSVLVKTFETVDAKVLVQASVQKAVDAAVSDARVSLERLQHEQEALMQQVYKMANMPLGRPTSLQRSVTPSSAHALDNVASYEDMLSVTGVESPAQTLAEVLTQTSIVDVPIIRNGSEIRTTYRRWPAGVGGAVGDGVRPPLTASQKTLMHWNEWDAYNTGGAVDVPMIDDPAERI